MKTYDEKTIKNQTKEDEIKEKKEYKRFISGAKSLNADRYRIAKNLKGIWEYNYVTDSQQDLISGHLAKRFAMLDKSYFKEFLSAVKSKKQESHYVSYLNDEDIKNGIYPSHFSALIKAVRYNTEEPASRILNFFGVNTVFYKNVEAKNEEWVLSLDCIKPNQRFIPFQLKNLPILEDRPNIERIIINFKKSIKDLAFNIINDSAAKTIDFDIDKLISDVVKSYLVRFYILFDTDFINNRNYALLYDEYEHKIEKGVNFDFEHSLMGYIYCGFKGQLNASKKDFEYIKKNFPDLYEDFKDKFYKFKKEDKNFKYVYEKIVCECNISNKDAFMICDNLDYNVNFIERVFDELEYDKPQRQ